MWTGFFGGNFRDGHAIGGGGVPFPCVHAFADDGGGGVGECERDVAVCVADGDACVEEDVGRDEVGEHRVGVGDRCTKGEVGNACGFECEAHLDRGYYVGGVTSWIIGWHKS